MSETYAVIIPTRNRVEVLLQTLQSVYTQNISLEVYVMEDAGSDDTGARVAKEFPAVKYFREEKNKGPTFQRNKAAKMTSARIIFTLDDDCILESPDTLAKTLEGFDDPRVGAVTIPHKNPRFEGQIFHAAKQASNGIERGIECYYDFYGGMVAFRRDVFLGVGGYREYLFMHVEESDLAVRIYNAGYVIRLGWATPLNHLESPQRNNPRLDILEMRNHILFAFYNVPWPYFPVHLVATTINSFRSRRGQGSVERAMRGLWRGYSGMFHEFFRRKPVCKNAYLLSRKLRKTESLQLKEIEDMLPPIKDFQGK